MTKYILLTCCLLLTGCGVSPNPPACRIVQYDADGAHPATWYASAVTLTDDHRVAFHEADSDRNVSLAGGEIVVENLPGNSIQSCLGESK